MWNIFRFIRIRTIIFATLTMYAMRYWVILPMLELNGFTLQMTDWAFSLLVLAVCCLIAGAYVINDYFDAKADRISRVKEVVIDKNLSRRSAIALHSLLNAMAVFIAFYLAFAVGVWKIGILFLLVSGILWFYSSSYKRHFIIGNIIVGLLAAFIPICALLYEIPLLNMAYADTLIATGTNFTYMFNWIFAFSWFIFLNILMYEINKDIFTIEGDREKGNQTIPVKLGISVAQNTIVGLAVIAILSAILFCYIEFSNVWFILSYIIGAVLFPYIVYIFIIKKTTNRYLQLNLIRTITVLCIVVSIFFKHFFQLIFID